MSQYALPLKIGVLFSIYWGKNPINRNFVVCAGNIMSYFLFMTKTLVNSSDIII
jgi:hypothetical protein